jgi:hypothetical protein
MKKPPRVALIMGGVLLVLVAVFALKVWHARGICTELDGQWDGLECVFLEKSGSSPRQI